MDLIPETYQLKIAPTQVKLGERVKIRLIDKSEIKSEEGPKAYQLRIDGEIKSLQATVDQQVSGVLYTWQLDTNEMKEGGYFVDVLLAKSSSTSSRGSAKKKSDPAFTVIASSVFQVTPTSKNPQEVSLPLNTPTSVVATNTGVNTSERARTPDLPLWITILEGTQRLSFENYNRYMDFIFCDGEIPSTAYTNELTKLRGKRFLPFTDTDGYRTLKVATEAFLMVQCGVRWDRQHRLTDENGTAIFDEDRVNELLDQRGLDIDPNGRPYTDIWNDYLQSLGTIDSPGNPGQEITLRTIPYLYLIRRKLKDLPLKIRSIDAMLDNVNPGGPSNEYPTNVMDEDACFGIIASKLTHPCFVELIWSYWMEECMIVQCMNAISQRFQNIRGNGKGNPLAGMEIDPLRPLNNLLWGYIQDEQHRLTVKRRAYEYLHAYGFSLIGKAVPTLRPADTRTKFLGAFHRLLYLCAQFYKQEDNANIKADAFPLRNALREVHLILSEGAHNQYGDLPTTARTEMMMQQWLLARPEFRQYIPRRNMVAYPEPWMPSVAGMNTLMGWNMTSPVHFANLAIFGERLLLSIRFGSWSDINIQSEQAAVWANFWRPAIQEYIHAYHGVTGVDLTAQIAGKQIDSLPPSYHIARQIKQLRNGQASLADRKKALKV